MQHLAFGVHLVEFQPAGFRHTQAMPERQKQKATVAGLVPTSTNSLDQPFNLAPGEVLAVAVTVALPRLFSPTARPLPLARFPGFASIHHFVESFPCRMPLKPLQTGQGAFALSTKCFILSRVKRRGRLHLLHRPGNNTCPSGGSGSAIQCEGSARLI